MYALPAYTPEIPAQISATQIIFLVQELFTDLPKSFLGVYYLFTASGLFVFQILTFQISGFVTLRIFFKFRIKKEKKFAEKEENRYT